MTGPRADAVPALVGRAREQATLLAEIDAALNGRGSAVLVWGEAGLGKTALIEYAATRADFDVLHCRGLEVDMALPFSGLRELLPPLSADIAGLPHDLREPLRVATQASTEQTPPLLTVALGTLTAIAQRAARRPVLLIVDDVQWLDEATTFVLSFVARRIAHDAISLVLASRTVDIGRVIPASRIDLGPLAASEARELAQRESERLLPATTADAVAAATGGNPLAVIETMRLLGSHIDRVGSVLDAPLPTGELIGQVLGKRIADLPERSFALLAIATIALQDSPEILLAAAAHLGADESDLDLLEDAHILRLEFGRVSFTHPLLRSSAYHRADAALRQRCHAALAQVVTDRGLRAWHAASATTTPDDRIADDLAAFAVELQSGGAHLAAARALERAAGLTVDPQQRATRLLLAGERARLAGRAAWSKELLDEAYDRAAPGSAEQLRIERERIIHTMHTDSAGGAIDRMLAVARAAEEVDPDLAVEGLSMVAGEAILQNHNALASDVIDEIEALPAPVDRDIALAVQTTTAWVHLIARGDVARGEPMLVDVARELVQQPGYWSVGTALHLIERDRIELARQVIGALLDDRRQSDDLHTVSAALWMQSYLLLRNGEWAAAEVGLEQSIQLAEAGELRWQHSFSLALLAIARAQRGDASVSALIDAARDASAGDVDTDVDELLRAARGHEALAQGRHADAAAALEPLAAWTMETGSLNPNFLWWRADLIEAFVLAGDEPRATEHLAWFRGQVERSGAAWTRAAVARIDGVRAADDAFSPHFEEALALHDGLGYPFEAARAHLHYGRRLRAVGRRDEARRQLERARVVFERLAATPWLGQTTRELDAMHPRAVARPADTTPGLTLLTPQERVIAALVAEGLTNKAIAARLFVTVKTVEWHLRQIFRKLDIRSRVQLATLVHHA